MDAKRRADLQRKLSMGAVPRPPAGLADRIKADIPQYLEAHTAPERFSWATSLRIAASILTLVATALITRELLEPRPRQVAQTARREKLVPAVMRYPQSAAETASAPRAETEVSLDITQDIPLAAPAAPAVQTGAETRRAAADVANEVVATEAAGATGGVAGRVAAETADFAADAVQLTVAEAPPPPPPPAVAAPAPVAPPAVARTEAAAETSVAYAPRPVAQSAVAAAAERERPDVFGISVDPKAFAEVRSAIESGSRPRAASIDVEALVNYFAGSRTPRRGVELEVEASPAPIAADGDRAILRFTVDTEKRDSSDRGAPAAIARDARLHIEIDRNAVAHFRRIGGDTEVTPQSALGYSLSVTGLYELELKPSLRSTQRIATVRLTYVSAKDGRRHAVTRVVRGGDLARTWDRASRRHRLAALGAVWSETLKGNAAAPEVARRAEELATENPSDARARELANAASASGGGAP